MPRFIVILVQILWRSLHRLAGYPACHHRKAYCLKPVASVHPKNRRKPDWVIQTLIHYKAMHPGMACRALADAFNRQYGQQETISHTTVNNYLRQHKAQVLMKRQQVRSRQAVIGSNNRIWGVDLTGKQIDGKTCWILGGVDHGTRACVILQALSDKRTISILRVLLDAIERFGKPQIIRTDNEAVFTSKLFCWTLRLLRINHQRTDIACPWQNGRIERLFGTLKDKLNQVDIHTTAAFTELIRDFRFWYNHIRTHQSLQGHTPAEVWDRRTPKPYALHYSAWDGLLTGFYHPT